MAPRASATTLLEFLTCPNPIVDHIEPNSFTNTRGKRFYSPKETKRWDFFEDYGIFKSAFRGLLYQAALQKRTSDLLPPYYHRPVDGGISNELKTKALIEKWNHSIVTQSLAEIDEFRPAYWFIDDDDLAGTDKSLLPLSPDSISDPPRGTRRRPPRRCSSEANKPRSKSRHRRIPDGGSRVLGQGSSAISPNRDTQERFIKEYKPALKWSSEKSIGENLLDRGYSSVRWQVGDSKKEQAWPIRQAYTYCVDNMCRYGCILTCKEAFIFRVQPLQTGSGGGDRGVNQLQKALIDNGKMEYVSIPWDNHVQIEDEGAEIWTVNLALWFFHVLAGHRYELAWEYDPNEYERMGDWLVAEPQRGEGGDQDGQDDTSRETEGDRPAASNEESHALPAVRRREEEHTDNDSGDHSGSEGSDGSDSATQRWPSQEQPVTPSRKRRRESESPGSEGDTDDGYLHSFSKRRH